MKSYNGWKTKLGTRLNNVKTKIRRSFRDMEHWCYVYDVPREKRDLLWELNFSEEQIEEVRDAFSLYDKKFNGTISPHKLIKVMRSLGKNPTEDEIDDMKYDVYTDMDGNGVIRFLEFLEMIACYRPDIDETLKEALELFDDDGSGFVNMKSFHSAMTTQGARIPEEEFQEIVRHAGKDEEGNTTISELIHWLKNGSPVQ